MLIGRSRHQDRIGHQGYVRARHLEGHTEKEWKFYEYTSITITSSKKTVLRFLRIVPKSRIEDFILLSPTDSDGCQWIVSASITNRSFGVTFHATTSVDTIRIKWIQSYTNHYLVLSPSRVCWYRRLSIISFSSYRQRLSRRYSSPGRSEGSPALLC